MRREYASIAAMAALMVGSQAVAVALSPLFQGGGYQAFPNPSDVTNTAVYVILILVFTAVILGLVRYRRQNLAKYVIYVPGTAKGAIVKVYIEKIAGTVAFGRVTRE